MRETMVGGRNVLTAHEPWTCLQGESEIYTHSQRPEQQIFL